MKRFMMLSLVAMALVFAKIDAASIITHSGAQKVGEWTVYRKTFNIEGNVDNNVLRIAADSKYWLYVNGNLEVFEGQLKRGPNPKDTYIDYVKLNSLRKGNNTIAVLVWFWNKDGFSHRNSKHSGLYFDLAVGKKHYESDGTWRVLAHPAYYNPGGVAPNYRLPETCVGFDASKDVAGIYGEDFDDSAWPTAVTMTPEDADWNMFVKREIPQWKDYGAEVYPSQRREGNKMICTLPYNCQFTPILHIKAKAGKKIDIRTDCYRTGGPHGEPNVFAEYITKDGEQAYESYGWMNGHEVIYTIPEGVEVIALGYRETGYDCAFSGSFECDNAVLNSLWKKSQRTLYVTMRDNYMDCPDRERGQWIGDVSNEMVETFYSMSPSAELLTRKCIREFADWQRPDSVMYAPVPAGNWNKELPMQTMAFMGLGVWNYYMGSGDRATLEYVYPAHKRYMHKWKITDNGLVEYRPGAWDWGDWGTNADMQAMCQEWYSITLQSYAKQAEMLGHTDEAKWANDAAKKLNDTFRSTFWTGKGYRFNTYKGKTDDRTQSLAVLAGIATADQYPEILNLFKTTKFASPYMERYVLEAMCEMGFTQEAMNRMIDRYKPMVDSTYSTLWELFKFQDASSSYNHAWSGGPLIIMSKYIAGIAPEKPAFEEFNVKPELCNLNFVNTVVPTVFGSIKLSVNVASGYKMGLSVPRGTKAHVYLPKDYETYSVDGHKKKPKLSADGTRKVVTLSAGKHYIENM